MNMSKKPLFSVSTSMPREGKAPGNPAWVEGHDQPGPGRPAGSRNRLGSERLKNIDEAVEAFGDDIARQIAEARAAKGLPPAEHPLQGEAAYVRWLLEAHPTAGAAIYARRLPNQTQLELSAPPVEQTYDTIEKIQTRFRELGLPERLIGRIYPLAAHGKPKADETANGNNKSPTDETPPSKEDEPTT
jgi:hypothetical protein